MKPDIVATVAAITVICYLVCMGCKASGKLDKWIPVIVGAVGAALGVVGMYTIKEFPAHDVLNALAVGIASGLASTGINQVVKQLSQSDNSDSETFYPDEEDEEEDDEE